ADGRLGVAPHRLQRALEHVAEPQPSQRDDARLVHPHQLLRRQVVPLRSGLAVLRRRAIARRTVAGWWRRLLSVPRWRGLLSVRRPRAVLGWLAVARRSAILRRVAVARPAAVLGWLAVAGRPAILRRLAVTGRSAVRGRLSRALRRREVVLAPALVPLVTRSRPLPLVRVLPHVDPPSV